MSLPFVSCGFGGESLGDPAESTIEVFDLLYLIARSTFGENPTEMVASVVSSSDR